MAETATKTRNLLKPVIAGVILIATLILVIAFRGQLSDLISKTGSEGGSSILKWIGDHPTQTVISVVAFLVFLAVNYLAHIAGRLRAWLFVVVVEAGLWFLFWNEVGIPALKDLVGLDTVGRITFGAQLTALVIILFLSGIVFWILEAIESFKARRHRTGGGD